jgi:hypothetical protein
MTLDEVIGNIYVNCDGPTDAVLPLGSVIPIVGQTNAYYNAGLELSEQHWYLKKKDFWPVEPDVEIPNGITYSDARKVEMRDGNAPALDPNLELFDSYMRSVDNVGFAALTENSHDREYAYCIYDTNPHRIRFSWNPGLYGDMVRLWYVPLVATPDALDKQLSLPSYYHYMVAHRAALRCLPIMLKRDSSLADFVRAQQMTLGLELKDWEAQFEVWKRTPRQSARTRMGAFNRNRS